MDDASGEPRFASGRNMRARSSNSLTTLRWVRSKCLPDLTPILPHKENWGVDSKKFELGFPQYRVMENINHHQHKDELFYLPSAPVAMHKDGFLFPQVIAIEPSEFEWKCIKQAT
ncbi:hypothetical protein K469DRAFT_765483 [Zopfia rhizophila CBS 207.26]|uniref:Uncharacterized protein n=1 Tax=Zopfia rhizophila CBS 207.26 TaxID=1314779 RepID=A0A6A6D9U2_9PEZI|nr:hypothetical protein K469DRAFT_765483 [Zopfia rhizophila CBS 207.26]